MNRTIHKAVVIALGLLLSLHVKATLINGIEYTLNSASKTATVTKSDYTGAVTIPSSVIYNGLSYSVTSIGQTAFSGCYGLTSVSIPNSVTSIGYQAFYGCTKLTSIIIPQSVTSIGVGLCYNCPALAAIRVEIGNTVYDSRQDCNAIIEKSSNTLIQGCKTSVIPNSVTSIGECAFAFCDFKTISIPSSVQYIGNEAFYGCGSLTSIDLGTHLKSIGNSAFYNCRNLASLNIPNSVTTIGNAAFYRCEGLKSIKSNIETPFAFGDLAFSRIASTCTLSIPKGTKDAYIITGWTEDVFRGGFVEKAPNISFEDATVKSLCIANWDMNGDDELDIDEAAAVTSLSTVFKGNTAITQFEELSYFKGLASISTNAFRGCVSLAAISIPDGIASIGSDAFRSCSSLTAISIPEGVTSISSQAFMDCEELTSINLPDGLTSIGGGAFYGCKKITEIILPQSINSIGKSAFNSCVGLKTLTIPSSVNRIENNTFYGCSNLTSITIPSEIVYIGNNSFYNCTKLSSIVSQIREPFSFGTNAFEGVSMNCSLTIPYGKKESYIATGWTEDVFKGGIEEMPDTRTNQALSLQSIPSMIYGAINYTLPLKTQQNLTLVWSSHNTNIATISGNVLTVKGAGTATITATQAGNDEYKPFSKEFILTVAKAPLTIAAHDFTRYEGEENPVFTVTYEGFVKNEDASVLSSQPIITTTAGLESIAGSYPITVSGATAANYDITFVTGTLTVHAKTVQTIAITSLPSMTYGEDAYVLPPQTEEGFDLTWASQNTDVAIISGNTLIVKGAGTTTITATQVGNSEYKYFSKEFTLTVAKASLTITANDTIKNVGDVNPAFTASYEGFVNEEDASVLTAQPTFTTQADENSPVGTYAIVVSGTEAANYEMNFVNGTLTVVDERSVDNTLAISDTQVLCGRQIVLPVSMSNTEDITAIQFDLILPTGVSIAKNSKEKYIVEKTERCASHTLSASKPGDVNMYKVLMYSTEVESIMGNEGPVISVTLETAEDMEADGYEIIISNINLTTTSEKKITPADVTCILTVHNSIPGDANGDGAIDVTDIVGIANGILGHASNSFDSIAGDVNDDGSVDVTDIVVVANMILHDGGMSTTNTRKVMRLLDPQ